MGICQSSKNQNTSANNTQNSSKLATPVNQTQTSTLINEAKTPLPPSSTVVKTDTKLEQNINPYIKSVTYNTNAVNGEENKEINNQLNKILNDNEGPSFDRKASMGSSIYNEDSIGYNQTRHTLEV